VQLHTDLKKQGLQTLLQHAQQTQLRPLVLVLPSETVFRVVWRGIAQELITKLEEQARPAGPLPDTAVSVFRLPARNQAKTAEGAAVPAVAPFDAAAARQYQEAWAEHLQVPVEYTNSIGMKFRLIPPGRFLMGSTAEQVAAAKPFLYTELDPARKDRADAELPQHQVTLTRPFYLGITEVTQDSFRRVTGVNPASLTEGPGDRLQAPVETVTWINCVEFCNQLSQGEGLEWAYRFTPDLVTQTGVGGYRLPTEAEWEFACRAGTTTQFHTGDDPAGLAVAAWIAAENGHQTKPVAQKQPNAFGLFDMHGNVFEWVHDAWRQDWYSTTTGAAAIDPRCDVGIEGRRIVRGGEKSFSWAEARSGARDAYAADSTWWDTGFRVALSVEAVRALRAAGR
jgi:formylglycine-generating enzyme required for sulfatase activity